MTTLPKGPVIAALAAEFAALDDLLSSLSDADWSSPTPLPGWDVQANVAHIIGTESAHAGLDAPGEPDHYVPHVRNTIGAFNEAWVRGLATVAPAEVLERFRTITAARLAHLQQMDQATWDAEGSTPAGNDTYGRFMRIRVFDCWMHEQDIRDGVGRPGHDEGPEVDLAVDEMVSAMGFVVGKKAGAPTGSSVTFLLTSTGTGTGTGASPRPVHVLVAERASVVPALEDPATVTITLPVGVYTRLGGGRVSFDAVAEQVSYEGDAELGTRVLQSMAYTI